MLTHLALDPACYVDQSIWVGYADNNLDREILNFIQAGNKIMLSNGIRSKCQKDIEANISEYGDQATELNWVTPERAVSAEKERAAILSAMDSTIELSYNKTKPHLGSLSPGCRICGEGGWSCLFINGKCNCNCFYCPTTQDEISIPTTNRIPFTKSRDYAEYIHHFGFRGVSISGGEPLITFDKTLRYIEAVRNKMGDDLHIWLYTNGTLLTVEHVQGLRSAGLNEMRFDLSAVNYDLKKIGLAAGKIPCITVEIPAIPEDSVRLTDLLKDMVTAGVDHLNLHQLRMTPHNSARLIPRPYTFLHGEKVTVLESELTALAVMQRAHTLGIGLPINYCSFVYKHHYQRAASRRRNAPYIAKNYEGVTQNGFIRALALLGPADILSRQAERFHSTQEDCSKWLLTEKKDRLFFHESLWQLVDFMNLELRASYSEAILSAQNSYRRIFKEIRLNPKFKLFVEKQPHIMDVIIPCDQISAFETCLASTESNDAFPSESLSSDIRDYELIHYNLQKYF